MTIRELGSLRYKSVLRRRLKKRRVMRSTRADCAQNAQRGAGLENQAALRIVKYSPGLGHAGFCSGENESIYIMIEIMSRETWSGWLPQPPTHPRCLSSCHPPTHIVFTLEVKKYTGQTGKGLENRLKHHKIDTVLLLYLFIQETTTISGDTASQIFVVNSIAEKHEDSVIRQKC